MAEHYPVAVIGAGQGGLGVSYYLKKANVPHVVLDRGGIANAWKANRWDSFCLVTPNWTINLPGKPYEGDDTDGFMLRDDFVDYMTGWAEEFGAPVRSGIDVSKLSAEGDGFLLETSEGDVRADNVVVATATYQHPKLPAVSSKIPAGIRQLHAEEYKNAAQAADGAVLVVGSGQTGCQIVEDMLRAGRKVHLCVARTGRLPRRYRGRDSLCWQRDMGLLDRTPDMLDSPAQRFVGDPHVTGRDGGATVSLHDFRRRGVTLLGRLVDIKDNCMHFGASLAADMAFADDFAVDFRAKVDAHIAESGIDAPAPTPDEFAGDPDTGSAPIHGPESLDMAEADIRTVIWATGFSYDFSWIEFPVTDALGYPETDNGATSIPGLFFSGLNWMIRRKSGILYGVDADAKIVSKRILQRLDN